MTDSDIVDLSNTVHEVTAGGETLYIAGLDCVYANQQDLASVLEKLPDSGAAVLLVHEPDFVDEAAATLRLPWDRNRYLPPLGEKYPVGACRT